MMIQITPGQYSTMAQIQRQRFLDACADDLRAIFPDAASLPRSTLLDQVRVLVDQLCELGFSGTDETAHALRLVYRFQRDDTRDPMPADIASRLRSPTVTIEKKIEALEQLFIFARAPASMVLGTAAEG